MPSVVSVIEHDHVIRSTASILPDETLFWGGNGWGDLASATGYTEREKNTVSLPMGGEWAAISDLKHRVRMDVTDTYPAYVDVLAASPQEAVSAVQEGRFDPSEITALDDPETTMSNIALVRLEGSSGE